MLTTPDLLVHERLAWTSGRLLIGVDEVGRGPLAGPVVAAAVVFDLEHSGIPGVRDSKQVKKSAERRRLASLVCAEALAYGIGAASVSEIARFNIRLATALAMHRAVARCHQHLSDQVEVDLLVDGHSVPELGFPHSSLVKGDSKCHAIAAAAIVAKVTRDRLMTSLALRWPGYSWDTNSGYGSAAHIRALGQIGMTPHHREQFCQTALGRSDSGGI